MYAGNPTLFEILDNDIDGARRQHIPIYPNDWKGMYLGQDPQNVVSYKYPSVHVLGDL